MTDHLQAQILDLQQRVTALEQTPRAARPDGAGGDLVQLVIKAALGAVKAATEARQGVAPANVNVESATPRGKLAEHLARAQVAAGAARAAQAAMRAEAPQQPAQPQGEGTEWDRLGIVEPGPTRFARERAEERAQAHDNALQRAEPNPNALTLWARDFTEHVDVTASLLSNHGTVRLRVTHSDRAAVQAFVRDHGGDLHACWRSTTYRIRSMSTPRGQLDVELEETLAAAELIEAPKPHTLADLDAMKGDKASCPGCNQPERGHYPWCPAGFTASATPDDGTTPEPPMPGDPDDKLTQAASIYRRMDNLNATLPPLSDLYARLDQVHDAVLDEEDEQ